ncbi:MAG: hypothetical protein JKY33_03100 [Bacteroidia bacterium]|nr:hypothetical protein [Bacteroidia bacterium]
MKIIKIIAGLSLMVLGLLLTFGITLYSLKENDNNGFYGFILSFSLIALGGFIVIRTWKLK